MKKLFLLSAIAAMGVNGASAQSAANASTSNQKATVNVAKQFGLASTVSGGTTTGTTGTTTPSGKATAGGSRWYSYTEYCNLENPDFVNNQNLPYMWDKPNGMAIFSDGGGGLIADTIILASYGMSFDPAFSSSTTDPKALSGYNEPTIFDNDMIVVRRTDAYTIDSVRVFGFYGRNTTRTSPVDTLRITAIYGGASSGSDMPIYSLWGATTRADYGVDTLRFAAINYDAAKNTAEGTTLIVKDVYLDEMSIFDTIPGGMNMFQVPVGLNVPAGNLVGITVTFKTGDTYIPYVDTIFFGSARSDNPFGRGMFRPSIFEQNAGTYPKYWPGYYNVGMVKNLPENVTWASDIYVPSFAYVEAFPNEVPNIDVKVSCAACNTIRELGVNETSVLDKVGAYPNPSATELNIPFTLLEKASVNVNITNMVGQVVATQNMGQYNAGQKGIAIFNTTSLPNGVYLYTVEANGQRITNRFTVAH